MKNKKNIVYMLDDILKPFEKQTQPNVKHNHNRQIMEDTPVNITSGTQQRDTNTNRMAINNKQKENPNYTPVNSNSEEPNENNTTGTRY